MKIVEEPIRHVPVVSTWDVMVCGAGPAGIAAAVASAWNGARTCLVETHGCLGGIWTSGSLSYILDGKNKKGILTELLARLDAKGARQGFVGDVETIKLVLEEMCTEAGYHIRLHTRVHRLCVIKTIGCPMLLRNQNPVAESSHTPGAGDFHFYTLPKPKLEATMLGIGCQLLPGLHDPHMTFDHSMLLPGAEILARAIAATFET